jgi:hypothetical protein
MVGNCSSTAVRVTLCAVLRVLQLVAVLLLLLLQRVGLIAERAVSAAA